MKSGLISLCMMMLIIMKRAAGLPSIHSCPRARDNIKLISSQKGKREHNRNGVLQRAIHDAAIQQRFLRYIKKQEGMLRCPKNRLDQLVLEPPRNTNVPDRLRLFNRSLASPALCFEESSEQVHLLHARATDRVSREK